MTTHADLIARLREMAGRLRLEAADAIESLEQQVAALTSAVKDAEVVCDSYAAENQRLSDEKDALTKERDELAVESENNFIHCADRTTKLAAAQAREAKLRGYMLNTASARRIWGGEAERARKMLEECLAIPADDSALKERLEEEMGNADVTGLAPEGDKS